MAFGSSRSFRGAITRDSDNDGSGSSGVRSRDSSPSGPRRDWSGGRNSPSGAMASGAGAGGEALHYVTALSGKEKQVALAQLILALDMHSEQLSALEKLCEAAR